MIRDLGPAVVDAMVADSPMKRLGSPEEVARLVAWLCSDACTFNTGALFDMSGGRARYRGARPLARNREQRSRGKPYNSRRFGNSASGAHRWVCVF